MKRLALLAIGLLALLALGRAPAEAQPAQLAQSTPNGDSTPYTSGLDGATARRVGEYEPPLPPLIVPSEGAYALRPDWDIEAIEYDYANSGWAIEPYGHVRIERVEGEYRRGEEVVPTEDVRSLVRSVARLYPTQSILSYRSGTDNYPTWKVELTGTDGQRVQLLSYSTGNMGAVPWNVSTVDSLYAQFDRSLEDPLFAILGDVPQKPRGRSDSLDSIAFFGSSVRPNQIIYGFWGLLPLSESFSYKTDPTKAVIEGTISQPDEVHGIEITLPSGRTAACGTVERPRDYPGSSRSWQFTCSVAGGTRGEPYSYPIAISVSHEGHPERLTGVLWGRWGIRNDPVMPVPYEISLAFSHNQAASDLLSDHILYRTHYAGSTTAGNPHSGVRNGEIALMGRIPVGHRYADYTIATRFEVMDGGLTYWPLDRATLSDMLARIAAFPTTRLMLDADRSAVVNMWYGSPKRAPELKLHRGGLPDQYIASVMDCGDIPGGGFPFNGEPLRAFGYNLSPWSVYQPDFVLVGDRPVASSLMIDTTYGDPARLALLPEELRTTTARPFERVRLSDGITLELDMPPDATPEERAEYGRIAGKLPGLPYLEGNTWSIGLATLSPREDGSLEVVSCTGE